MYTDGQVATVTIEGRCCHRSSASVKKTKRNRRRGIAREQTGDWNSNGKLSTFKPPPAPILLRPALLHKQQHVLVEAVETAIDMLLSGSHTSAGRRPTAGAQSNSSYSTVLLQRTCQLLLQLQ
jgi:hypothetical protein